jgi:hypothetical protein
VGEVMIKSEFVYIGNESTMFNHGDVYKVISFTNSPNSYIRIIDKNGQLTSVSQEHHKLLFVTKSTWRDMKLNKILLDN